MKPVRRSRSGGDSCSCSTCVYKSESDHPSLRRIIDRGSKIDRLYFGKYIPLRERKLLERLVRTRAVYDDIRAQLVSDSSLSTKEDSNPRRKRSIRAFDDSERSSAGLLEIVNMVDRGAVGSANLDDCCSCCSCSGIKLHEHKTPIKRYNKKRPYAGANEHEARERVRVFKERRDAYNKRRGVRFKTKFIKSDPCTCTYKLIKKHSKAIYNKMHHHRPLPRLELQTTTDEELYQRPPRIREIARASKEKISEGIHKIKESQTRIREKLELQTKASLEKFNQAKQIIKSGIRDGAQKLKEMSYKEKSESHTDLADKAAIKLKKDSIIKFNEEQRRRQIMKDWECEPECVEDVCLPDECLIKLKRRQWHENSASNLNTKKVHNKGIRYNIRTQDRKTGDPLRQIKYKIQAQELAKPNNVETEKPPSATQNIQEMKKLRVKFDKSPKNKKMQNIELLDINGENNTVNIPGNTKPHQKISAEEIKTSHLKTTKLATIKGEKTGVTKKIPTTTTPEKFSKLENRSLERLSSERQAVRIGSSFSFDIEFYKTKPGSKISTVEPRPSTDNKQYFSYNYDHQIPSKDKKPKKIYLRQQGSQIGIEKSLRHTQTGSRALKRCFCTLKLKPKASVPKIRRSDTKNVMTDKESGLNSVAISRSYLLQYECEPGVCIPGECNPNECIKFINKREAKRKDSSTQALKTKSTSSYTLRSDNLTKEKYIQSTFVVKPDAAKPAEYKHKDKKQGNAISYSYRPTERVENVVTTSQRQAVRIGSTFSFNVEFYKTKPVNDQQLLKPSNLKSLSIKPKQQKYKNLKDRGYQGKVQHTNKNSQKPIIKKERNARIGNTLRRCFCTLKLQKMDIPVTKNYSKDTFTIDTETSQLVPIASANKSSTAHIKSSLLPYECEPGVCVPGSCNPYDCIKLINIREAKLKNTSSQARRTKSSSSYTSTSFKPVKEKHVQSLVTPRGDAAKSAAMIRGKEIGYSHRPTKRVTNLVNTSKQAVRVGSTFSFNIEFYKGDPYNDRQIKKPSKLKNLPIKQNEYKKVRVKERGYQGQVVNTRKNNETQIMKKERNARIGTSFKRCFCTLKLQKNEVIKNHSKETFTTGTETTEFIPVPPLNKGSTAHLSLFPYECEPGVCIPGDCNPYECVKLIHIRDAKRKNASSQARKKKSTSSYTSRSYNPAKAKYVQSMIISRDVASKPLAVKKRDIRRENIISDTQRQTVRIGSTFSFNIEFYKGSPYTEQQITRAAELKNLSMKSNQNEFQKAKLKDSRLHENIKNIPKQKGSLKVKAKNRGFQENVKSRSRNTPTQMIKNERDAHIGTTLERCFCTLKLKRKKIIKKRVKRTLTSGTETSELVSINTENKSTKITSKFSRPLKPYECEPLTCTVGSCDPYVCLERIKRRKKSLKNIGLTLNRQEALLESYECEPFTCIPGECDPHVCLERIKRRNIRLKDTGSTTSRAKRTSSSSGNKPTKFLRSAKVQYKPKNRERWTKAKPHKTTGKLKHMKKREQENISNYPSSDKYKQAVKIGSKFSFEIDFFKKESPNNTIIKQIYPAESIVKAGNTTKTVTKENIKKNKEVQMNRLNVARIKTQVQGPTKRDTGSVVGPLLKRCFCTLNLQRKWKRQQSMKKSSPHSFEPPVIYPMVYTVNRATVKDKKAIERNEYQIPLNIHSEQEMLEMSRQCKETYELHPHRCIDRMEEFTARTVDGTDLNYNYPSSSLTHQTNSISLSHYYRRSFHIWNIKLENKGNFESNKITRDESNKKEKRVLHKLEPYECEPGVCIPGECDPYECQKLISKRFVETSAAKSGTDHSLHSMSTSARHHFTKSKGNKQQTLNQESINSQVHEKTFKKNQKLPKNHHFEMSRRKQAVHISSSFSVDIEFFKNLSMPHQSVRLPKYSSDSNLPKHVKYSTNSKEKLIKCYPKSKEKRMKQPFISEGTGKKDKLLNSQSQSSIQTTDRGTFTKPVARKRCFCTLKLQKKGRLHKELKNGQLLIKPNDYSKENTVTRGQNTTKIKPVKLIHALEPYECEPNICIPGQCDPYECLEIIKKRNKNEGVGTNTKFQNSKSISSITADNRSNKSHKSRAVNVKRPTTKKLTETAKDVKHDPYFNYDQKPFRQAVRVGSSFSFNLEFFKDYPWPSQLSARKELKRSKQERKSKLEKLKEKKFPIKPVLHSENQMDEYAQINEKLKNNASQIDHLFRHASTATSSLIKRCFCTAQLYKSKIKDKHIKSTNKINIVNQTNKNTDINHTHVNDINNLGKINNLELKPEGTKTSPSFLKRCMCILSKNKHLSTFINNKKVSAKESDNEKLKDHGKQVAKPKIHNVEDIVKLDPYECKPGICVPGQCDPYVCDKIMRNYGKKNFKTTANTLTTRSVSISSPNAGKKNVKTLKIYEKNYSMDKPILREKFSKKFPKRIDSINKPTVSTSPNRNVVKIGSNFSFDIEFYRDHPFLMKGNEKLKTKVKKGKKEVKRNEDHPSMRDNQKPKKDTESKKKVKINSTVTYSPSTVSQSAQVKKSKVKDRGTGINNFIKRCFCTLKLHENTNNNRNAKKEDIDERSIKTINKGVMTERRKDLVSNILLPYECEPNVCIPYQCDPYECEKRIKLRHKMQGNREFGISTETPKKVSVQSLTTTNTLETKNQAIKSKDKHPRMKQNPHKYADIKKVSHSKQSVRIGSTFSFNFEFFKDTNRDDFELHKHPKKSIDNGDYHRTEKKTKSKRKNTINQTKIDGTEMSTNQTQFDNHMMRTQSTMTRMKNRCFCTLSLKKSTVKPPLSTQTLHASVNTDTKDFKRSMQPMLNILPYECEPNFCIPGECNPILCLERINRRQKTFATATEDPQKINVATKMIKVKEGKNKKSQIERSKQLNSNKTHIPKTDNTKGERRAVRIGSNFSFDVEFFKENYPKYMNDIQKQQNTDKQQIIKKQKDKHRLKNQAVYNDLNIKKLGTRGVQSSSTKKVAHGTGPFLKRCFCTLTLQKNKVNKNPKTVSEPKVKQRKISTETKSTITNKVLLKSHDWSPYECEPNYCILGECDPNECEKRIITRDLIRNKLLFTTHHLSPFECEPGTCVPGECDPYECQKRIKIRDTENKAQNTRTYTRSQKGVSSEQGNIISRKTQANLKINDMVMSKSNIDKPVIVEVPRFNNNLKNQAVRIGSNFSFNIEIYKENLPQTILVQPSYGKQSKMKKQKTYEDEQNLLSDDKKTKTKRPKKLRDRDLNTGMTDLRSCESECDILKTENKSTESDNILKRCFCTLTLQNKPNSKSQNKNTEKIPYPQTFEVRRVAMEHNPIMLSKGTHMEVKSVSTKIDKKYLKNSHSKIRTGLNNETIELKTILPYKPDKFNHSVSKTILPLKIKYRKSREVVKNRGKKLSRKTSKRSLNTSHSLTQENYAPNSCFYGIKNFITYFAHIFYLNSKSQHYSGNKNNTIKKHNNIMLSDKLISNTKSRKCQSTCPYFTKNAISSVNQNVNHTKRNEKNFMRHEMLHMELNKKQEVKKINKNSYRPCSCSNQLISKKYSAKSKSLGNETWSKQQTVKKLESKNNQTKLKGHILKPRLLNMKSNPTQELVSKIKTEDKLSPCLKVRKGGYVKKERSSPLKVRFLNSTVSNYCYPCKGKYFNKEEFHKAAGDQLFNRKGLTRGEKTGLDLANQATKPLFEMRLDSGTYDILNRDQVFRNVKKLNTKYHKKPSIEIELDARKLEIVNKDLVIEKVINEKTKKKKIDEKKKGLKDLIIDSIMELTGKSEEKMCPCQRCVCATRNVIGGKVGRRKGKPCICGSSVCAERADIMKKPVTKSHKWKPCSCGSPVCGSESARIKALTAKVENKCLCHKEMAKRKAKLKAAKLKKGTKERAKRLKDYKKQDKIRRAERLRKQRLLERKIDKKAPDTILHTENVLDVGKFGVTLASDALRQAYRIARDPKHAYENLKTLKENPELILPCLESAYKDSGISGTLRRIRLRCFATRGVTKLRRALENNSVSRYLLYMGSTNPKKRLLKKKKKLRERERERLDFACSLYMASLRKRPHLSVYDRCPWFYPHFLRMVQVWKQFTDICLYIAAAVVWSPCILCMELCRACMCCFFCTG